MFDTIIELAIDAVTEITEAGNILNDPEGHKWRT